MGLNTAEDDAFVFPDTDLGNRRRIETEPISKVPNIYELVVKDISSPLRPYNLENRAGIAEIDHRLLKLLLTA